MQPQVHPVIANPIFFSQVYGDKVFWEFLPKWLATLLILGSIAIIIALVLRLAPSWHKDKRRLGQSLALAFWLTIVGYSSMTWLYTTFQTRGKDPVKTALWLAGAISILFATFILEGLEMAYSELRDKDEHQFEGKAAIVFNRLTRLGGSKSQEFKTAESQRELESGERDRRGGAFFEAREWWIVLLLVLTTLMLERDEYFVPWMAHVYESDSLGRVVRLSITIILTTFPFVWMAQSPGKYVARQNSVEFLSYRFTDLTILLLEWLWWVMRKVGLQFPAEEMDRLALRLLKNCNKERNLLPSEFSFFADGLKRYGYGILSAEDTIEIKETGACVVSTKTLSYVDLPRKEMTWFRVFEEGFPREVLQKLRNKETIKIWAFEGPLIGERVDENLMKSWNSLFKADDPAIWQQDGYVPIDTSEWSINPSIEPEVVPTAEERLALREKKKRFEETLTVLLDMRDPLPFQKKTDRKAMLVL